MSELHKFLFEGLPVRGVLVRLTDSWQTVLAKRAANAETGAYPPAVRALLGEMTAAAVLMQANIKFNGALVLQMMGEGPLKLAVVEVQSDMRFRSTAKTIGEVTEGMGLADMANQRNLGRCAITLDPLGRRPGQQPYQGVVPLYDDQREPLSRFSDVLAHYMLQSEQLDTTLVLAANDDIAAGLLIQRLPMHGAANLAGKESMADEAEIGRNEDFNRIAILAQSLTSEELLTLSTDKILHRLFWQET
ncbi:MAG: Hsp33 family molecular chaperone HslO, partial [Burkholderiaceae bacterium]|nr:Hsp33 family molecular chaperone HslO [Burkholderiaceae bacterium]